MSILYIGRALPPSRPSLPLLTSPSSPPSFPLFPPSFPLHFSLSPPSLGPPSLAPRDVCDTLQSSLAPSLNVEEMLAVLAIDVAKTSALHQAVHECNEGTLRE